MSGVAVGLGLALAASVALNAAFLLQHAGASDAPAITPRHPLATLRALLGRRLWVAGAALGMAGWALHVGALSRAPLSLVQAFVAGGIVFALPLAWAILGLRLDRGERAAVVLLAASLVLLSVGLGHPGAHARFSSAGLAAYLLGSGALAAALAAAPLRRERAAVLGAAGGVLYGAADMAIKALTAASGHGGLAAVVRSPWLPVAALCTMGAFFAFQRGLQAGRPVPVIALMTAGTNVVSIVGGLVVFGDPLGSTPLMATLHAAGFALVLVAAWRLAPVQAALQGAQPARSS